MAEKVRRKREGVMLAYKFDVNRLSKWPKPWFVQPKINGERCRAEIDREAGTVKLFSSTSRPILGVPHIQQSILESAMPGCTLDGELYHHGWKQQQIHSVVSRQTTLHPDREKVRFYCFDIIEHSPQHERIAKLKQLNQTFKIDHVRYAQTTEVRSRVHLMLTFDYYIDEGYEGIIVRHPTQVYIPRKTPFMMKMKNFHDEEFEVVGYKEERDKYGDLKGTLGAVTIKLPDGRTNDIGTGFTYDERVDLWLDRDKLLGRKIKVRYQELSVDGKLLCNSFKGFVDN